jgi:hypothetical protein
MPRQSTRAATAIRHLRESQDALLCKQVMQIRQAAAAGHLTAAETADAIELAHWLRDHTLRLVYAAFRQSAARFLAEPEPDYATSPRMLLAYATRCRAYLASLYVADGAR